MWFCGKEYLFSHTCFGCNCVKYFVTFFALCVSSTDSSYFYCYSRSYACGATIEESKRLLASSTTSVRQILLASYICPPSVSATDLCHFHLSFYIYFRCIFLQYLHDARVNTYCMFRYVRARFLMIQT